MFLLFFSGFVHRLRPVAVAAIGAQGVRRSLRDSVGQMRHEPDVFAGTLEGHDGEPTVVVRSNRAGAVPGR